MTTTESAVKERPILFRGEMVRAILDGKKTQTRRVVKPQPVDGNQWPNDESCLEWADIVEKTAYYVECGHCPYGQPGNRLWVRESFVQCPDQAGAVRYAATDDIHELRKIKPSIHMPRWACRLVLEIVKVRVERLQDITHEDARAEGAQCRSSFMDLWTRVHAKENTWEENPWLWVIEFRRVA